MSRLTTPLLFGIFIAIVGIGLAECREGRRRVSLDRQFQAWSQRVAELEERNRSLERDAAHLQKWRAHHWPATDGTCRAADWYSAMMRDWAQNGEP